MLALCTGLLALLLPQIASAEEPTRAEIQYRPDVYPHPLARTNALIAGSAMLVGGYGLSVGTSFLWADAPNAKDLRLPVVGPVLALTRVSCGDNESSCDTVNLVIRSVFAGVSGIVQLGGIGVLVEALFMRTRPVASAVFESSPETVASATNRPLGVQLTYASPSLFADGVGVSLGGRF
jgi:hypothetical protein